MARIWKMRESKSLSRTTMLQMAIRISIVVILASSVTYLHLRRTLESGVGEQLTHYTHERAQRENQWFSLLDLKLQEFRQEFTERYQRLRGIEPPGLFERYFESRPDGTAFVRKEYFSGARGPLGSWYRGLSGGVDDADRMTTDRRIRLILAMDMLVKYGPALIELPAAAPRFSPFLDLYFFNPEGDLEIYWPGTPWYPDFQRGFDFTKQDYFTRTFKQAPSPEKRERYWTGPYLDEVAGIWMVSFTIPIVLNGKIISALGADIAMTDLYRRLQTDQLKETRNLILREDGLVIADPLLEQEMVARKGNFNILRDGDPALRALYRLIVTNPGKTLLDDPEYDRLIALDRMASTGWLFVTLYPKSLMKSTAASAALFILILGTISLIVEVSMLWHVLQTKVSIPLRKFMSATASIASGDLSAKGTAFLPVDRPDELGELARSFSEMTGSLQEAQNRRLAALEELKAAKETAESASRVKSEFLDIAAHELRTPLTPLTLLVQGSQELLGKGRPVPAPYLDRMAQQTRRLTSMVDELLNVSRLERGGFPLKLERADLSAIVRESLNEFRTCFSERTFLAEGLDQEIIFNLDPARIAQVLSNLLDNATKYSPTGTPIEIRLQRSEGFVRVSITDHGPGIPKEQQKDLFTRFYRTPGDMTLRQPGLGLGLYICRRIIELHNGSIQVESEPGIGSTFSFELPYKDNRNA